LVEAVQPLDVGCNDGGLLLELAEGPIDDLLVALETTRHALPDAGVDAPGGAPDQQDLDAAIDRGPEDPAADEIRAEAHPYLASISCSCSRCIRSWTPANRSHSPQRNRPTSGCSRVQGRCALH